MTVIVKKDGKLSETVKFAFDVLAKYGKFDTYNTAGRGRFSHISRSEVGKALDCGAFEYFGIKYKVKNNAPRGGKLGEFMEINENAQKKLIAILFAFEH